VFAKIRGFARHSLPDFWQHPLWRKRRWVPFFRFASLQLRFALGPSQLLIPWLGGVRLPVRRGDHGLTGNVYLGLQECRDMAFALHLLRPGDLFLDVGANLGSYSLLAAGVAGSHCLAFEPVPSTFTRLQEALAINDLGARAEARNLALVGPERVAAGENLVFSADRDCQNSFVDASYPGRKIIVNISTLDEQCAGSAPTLMKVDVEGFEQDVLLGAQAVLAAESLLAIIIEGQTEAVNAILRTAGFADVSYEPFRRELMPITHYTPNRLWVRRTRLAEVSERLRSAPPHRVYGRPI
jgi:FkbM family methyltransferase